MFPKLQYISQGSTAAEQLRNIQEALDAGCSWIQLRFKNTGSDTVVAVAEKANELCDTYKAMFIVNDHPSIAKAVDADGVHLGLQDMPVAEARKIMGSEKIIGGTANTFENVMQRHNEGCDYVGAGPFRFTTTKEKLSPILGAEGYAAIINKMEQAGIDIPVFAIGGILPADIAKILHTGIYGIAVSGVITNHPDKKQIVHAINSLIYAKTYDSQ